MADKDNNKSAVSSMRDCYDYSPAQSEHYDFKKGVMGGIHIGGVSSEPRDAYSKGERKSMSKMAHMEQDKANY